MERTSIPRPAKRATAAGGSLPGVLPTLSFAPEGAPRPSRAPQLVRAPAVAAGSATQHGGGRAPLDLASLEAELNYRGPERRNGPGAGLARLLACVLDEVDYGLLLIAADGQVIHANHAARVELEASTSLQLVGKRLVGRTPEHQLVLDDVFAAAHDGGRRKMLSLAPVEVPGESVDGKPCNLSIVPLPAALSASHAGHAVLVALPRGRIAETLSVDAYARELGLSRREQQVLAALCDGLRAKEIAARLEIGEETVRSHVKRLKAKTGCASIVDIVNQLSRLPPMVSVLRR